MAAISKTQIANLALAHIKDDATLENIDTETRPQATYTKLWYDPARRQALVDMDAGFSRKRLVLAAHGNDPSSEWAFRYMWPEGCLIPRFIQNPGGRNKPPIVFDIEVANDGTQSILTGLGEATLVYTKDLEDPTFFTPHFVLALSYLLAHYVAGPLAGASHRTRSALMQSYNNAINTGGAHEANVTSAATEGAPEAGWIDAR